MESTFDHVGSDGKKSLKQAWNYCQDMFSASTVSEAWQYLKLAIDASPIWALLLLFLVATAVVVDSAVLIVPVAAGAFLFAIYHVTKRAVTDALRERDSGPG